MLKEKLSKDIIQAMHDRDTVAKAVLTVLKAAVLNEEKRLQRDITHDEGLTILQRERKQIKDSIEGFTKANRHDLIEKEQLKLAIVDSYLPKQLTVEELYAILDERGITSTDSFVKLMGEISKEYKGQVDGKTLSDVIRKAIKKV